MNSNRWYGNFSQKSSPKKERALTLPIFLTFKFYFSWNFLLFLLSFDLVAIGGISVVLIFDRSPFLPEKRTLWLPWNQFIVVEKVTMQRVMSDPPSCDISNFISPNPIVLPSPLTSFGGSCPERGTIVPELQVGTWTLTLQKYSKSPTYESSTCNLPKRRTCSHKLVHMSGIYCHILYKLLCFCVVYCKI